MTYDELEAEAQRAYQEAVYLAESIQKQEFRHESPDWEVCATTEGVISQIDNMYAGVRSQRDSARFDLKVAQERIEELEADKNRLDKINDDLADLIEHLTKNYHNERQNMIWVYQELGLDGQHDIRKALDKIKAIEAENKALREEAKRASRDLTQLTLRHDLMERALSEIYDHRPYSAQCVEIAKIVLNKT